MAIGKCDTVWCFWWLILLLTEVLVQQELSCHTTSFIEFVKKILQTYGESLSSPLLDNTRIHHTKKFQEIVIGQ
jgi:hypothetical protein